MITSIGEGENFKGVYPVAVFVLADEKAYRLSEVNLLTPNYKSLRRYQIVLVNRGDRIAEARKDLGPAESFEAMQFTIPSLWEHTVGELRDIADTLRTYPDRAKEVLPQPEDSRLIDKFFDLQEAKRKKGRIVPYAKR